MKTIIARIVLDAKTDEETESVQDNLIEHLYLTYEDVAILGPDVRDSTPEEIEEFEKEQAEIQRIIHEEGE